MSRSSSSVAVFGPKFGHSGGSLVNTDEKKLFKIFAFSWSVLARFSSLSLPSGSFLRSATPGLVFVLAFVYCQNLFGLSLALSAIFLSWSNFALRVNLRTWFLSLQYSLCFSPSLVSMKHCQALCFFLILLRTFDSNGLLNLFLPGLSLENCFFGMYFSINAVRIFLNLTHFPSMCGWSEKTSFQSLLSSAFNAS